MKKDENKIQALINYLQQNPIASNLAEIPHNLELICSIWKDREDTKKSDSDEQLTLTQLYEELVNFLVISYLEDQPNENKKQNRVKSTIWNEKKLKKHIAIGYILLKN